MGVVAATPRTAVGRVPALGGAAVAGTVVATACARRAVRLAAEAATAGVDDLVELLVVAVGAAALAWLAGSAAVAAACLVARATGRRWRAGEAWVRRFAPTVVRRALVVVVAAGLGAASVTTASASGPTPSPSTAATAAVVPGDDLGWVVTAGGAVPGAVTAASAAAPSSPPTWWAAAPAGAGTVAGTTSGTLEAPFPAMAPPPRLTPESSPSTTPPRLAATPAASGRTDVLPGRADGPSGQTTSQARPAPLPGAGAPGTTVVVAPGDTLWAIAARHLPPGSAEARIAAAWPAWYAANAATIGPDPGLIRPGQVLVVPEAVAR